MKEYIPSEKEELVAKKFVEDLIICELKA